MVPPVFKTGETEHLGLAGSIPVRLRQTDGQAADAEDSRGVRVTSTDPRRGIPRTDALLALPEVSVAREDLSETAIRALARRAQQQARSGEIEAGDVRGAFVTALSESRPNATQPVLNATGVVVHTNLGRAPLSAAAVAALVSASGYTDVELDLATGSRSRRGDSTLAALLMACPEADSVLVVNNGAAALSLIVTALAAGRDVVVSRGELIEIGAGFRLPDLIASTGPRLREVGTTNRTHLADYAAATGAGTGCILKVHPSNYTVSGFTSSVPLEQLRSLAEAHHVPLVADLGSGLLHPDPVLPHEPDVATALGDGADLVLISGDKLLGGPQAGIIFGRADLVAQLSRHPLARAFRPDKLTLAALEATLVGPPPPVHGYIRADGSWLRQRAERLGRAVGAPVVPHDGRVGGGGAPGVRLPGWAVRLPADTAARLRVGTPPVLARVHGGHCLVDVRCVPEADDDRLAAALRVALDPPDPGAPAVPRGDSATRPVDP